MREVYLAEAMADYDGKPGDSSGKEVRLTKFYLPSSKAWWLFRPIDGGKNIAEAAIEGANNDNIGYSLREDLRLTLWEELHKVGSMARITKKVYCACSDFARAAIWQGMKKDCGRFWSATALDVLTKSKLFKAVKKITTDTQLAEGDILVTSDNTHTAVVAKITTPTNEVLKSWQSTAKSVGVYTGGIDGTDGAYTQAAMKSAKAKITYGTRNALVTWCQKRLQELGYYKTGTIDGWCGSVMCKAINQYMLDKGIMKYPDSICGYYVWRSLTGLK